MRGKKSSASKPKNGEQETENLENLEISHLSGAYMIRSLVKQLSTSKTINPSPGNLNPGEKDSREQGNTDGNCEKQEKTHFPHKKQVRRRVQTRKPYQEKLLNMAEARREIMTALKLHRAAMKQAREKQNTGPEMKLPKSRFSSEQEAMLKSRRNPRIYASTCNKYKFSVNNYVDNINAYPPGLYSSPYSRPVASFAPPPLFIQENLNFVLPRQTLGLNLNLQDFNNLETSSFYSSANNSSLLYSSSSPSTSCSPAPSTAAEEIPYMAGAPQTPDASEVAEIRSIGDDQHQIGWDGNLNFEISAGRAEFLESMKIGSDQDLRNEDFVNSPFDEVMEFPAWMNANESCLQHVSDFCRGDYFQDPALPCMDIEEIEGMDGDWLA